MFRSILTFFLLILACAIIVVFYINVREAISVPKFNDKALDGALSRFQSRLRADLDDDRQRAKRELLNIDNDGVVDHEPMRKLVTTDLTSQLRVLKDQLNGTSVSMKTLDKDFRDLMKRIHEETAIRKLGMMDKNQNNELLTTLDDLKNKINDACGVVDQINSLRESNTLKFEELKTQLKTLETASIAKSTENTLSVNKQIQAMKEETEKLSNELEENLSKHDELLIKHLDGSLTNHNSTITKHIDDTLVKQNENVTKHIDDSLSKQNVPIETINDRLKDYNERLSKIMKTSNNTDNTSNGDAIRINEEHDDIMARLSEVNGTLKGLPNSLENRLMSNKQLLTTDNVDLEIISPIMDKLGVSLAKTMMDQNTANRLIVEPLKNSIVANTTSQLAPIRNDIIDRLDETRDALKLHVDSSGNDLKLRIKSNADIMTEIHGSLSDVATKSNSTLSILNGDALSKTVAKQVSKSNVTDIYEPLNKTITNLPKNLNVDFTPLLSNIKKSILEPINDELHDGLIKSLNSSVKEPIIEELREPMSKRIRKETQNLTKAIIDPIMDNLAGDAMIERIGETVVRHVGESIWSDTKMIDAKLIKPLGASMQNTITSPLMRELDGPMLKRMKSAVTDTLLRELDEPMTKRIKIAINPIISKALESGVKGIVNKAMVTVNESLIANKEQGQQLETLLKRIDELPKHIIIPDSVQNTIDAIRTKQASNSTSADIERLVRLIRQWHDYQTLMNEDVNKQTQNSIKTIENLSEKTERLSASIETSATRVLQETKDHITKLLPPSDKKRRTASG